MNLKNVFYGSALSLADVDPNNSYGWKLNLKKGSLPSCLISVFGVPHLGSRIRHRILADFLKKPEKNESVLDVGCGFGLESLYFGNKGFTVLGIDQSKAKISIAKKITSKTDIRNVRFKVADIFKSKDNKNYFDFVILFEVLEHVKNPQEMLERISGFVKKNGFIIVSFPGLHWVNALAKNYLGHEQIGYTPNIIRKLIKIDELKIEKSFSFGNSLIAKTIFFIDFILLKFTPILSAGFFFISYPFVVFDQKYLKSINPMGYILVIRKK